MPERINNLRVGEAFLLGNETSYGKRLEGFYDDAFILEGEIIELKKKQTLPVGETGIDSFGRKPEYEDRGIIKRAILALGRQDADPFHLKCTDSKIDVLGASSDHLILDVTKSDKEYQVGDIISFKLSYSNLLRSTTSPYVYRTYIY
jgi:predicted amino acid racemase